MAILSAEKITKRFPGVVALRDVSFDLEPGEIHALCGENGAGKSTLIKLLSGLHPFGSYEGELRVGGKIAEFAGIADAEKAGIAVIYQELALVDAMTVAENIFLGKEPGKYGFVDWPALFSRARELLQRFEVDIPPDAPVEKLGIGQKQLVEILKALAKDSRILILDEPTAALAEHEVQILLRILRDLRSQGIACIYISHRLEEVFSIADRITVLRDGSTISTKPVSSTSRENVIREMVGREITDLFPRADLDSRQGEIALEVRNLSVADAGTGVLRLKDISFSVKKGEVLGVGGLMGAGRTELLMHLIGAWGRRVHGDVELLGRVLPCGGPEKALHSGMFLVSEERRRYGLILEESIGFNLSLSSLGQFAKGGLIDRNREWTRNHEAFQSLRVKAPGMDVAVEKLSGGNQQKVVLGKALMTEPQVVLLDEPTRGIDIGAKAEIYALIRRLTGEGKAVVLVSSELPELIGLSDRILMLHEGAIGGEFPKKDATQEKLMAAAMGHCETVSS